MTNNKIDLTKPYQCRNGDAAEVVATDLAAPYPWLIVRTDLATGKKHAQLADENGYFALRGGEEHAHDLINIPEKRTYWVNFYDDYAIGNLTEESAKKRSHPDALKIAVPIEIEV